MNKMSCLTTTFDKTKVFAPLICKYSEFKLTPKYTEYDANIIFLLIFLL